MKLILSSFFYFILVSTHKNNSSLSDAEEVEGSNSSAEIENQDHHHPHGPESSFNYSFWISFGTIFLIILQGSPMTRPLGGL